MNVCVAMNVAMVIILYFGPYAFHLYVGWFGDNLLLRDFETNGIIFMIMSLL
jgi:hypothetical protein